MKTMNLDTTIFKAYDIRGIFPKNLDNDVAYKIGRAYASTVNPQGEVLVGEDVRIHSHELKAGINTLIAAGLAGVKNRVTHTHTPISEWIGIQKDYTFSELGLGFLGDAKIFDFRQNGESCK